MNNQYIAIDAEMGGPLDECSLLTVYFAIFDSNFNIINELDLKVKPNDGKYVVLGKSLDINKINLAEHDKVAITYKEAGTKLFSFLQSNSNKSNIAFLLSGQPLKDVNSNKYIPIGHGISGDIRKIKQCLISEGSWERFSSHRVLDTCIIAQFLRLNGLLPEELSCSRESLSEHFKIVKLGKDHEAKSDCLEQVEILKELNKLLNRLIPIPKYDVRS